MTAENMAKYRLDPNIDFWKELKNGADHFEVTKTEPSVVVCGKHYVFGATAKGEVSATAPCPALQKDEEVEALVADKEAKDDAKVAELAAKGLRPIRTVYADGGQNPVFANYPDTSDPDALAGSPQEIALEEPSRTAPAVVNVAASDAAKASASEKEPAKAPKAALPVGRRPAPLDALAAAPAPAAIPPQPIAVATTAVGGVAGVWGASTSNVKKWLHVGGDGEAAKPEAPDPAATAYVPDQAIPSDVPLPPRRSAADAKAKRVAQKAPAPPAKAADAATDGGTGAPDATGAIPAAAPAAAAQPAAQ